ncbi:unnamed protein product, partial [Rotaria sp. Silwood1]
MSILELSFNQDNMTHLELYLNNIRKLIHCIWTLSCIIEAGRISLS